MKLFIKLWITISVTLFSCNLDKEKEKEMKRSNTSFANNDEIQSTPDTFKWRMSSHFTGDASNYYAYNINWQKKDTTIEYSVDSKMKDTLIPVALNTMSIYYRKTKIHITFKLNYNINLPKLSYDFSDIDVNRISSISIYPNFPLDDGFCLYHNSNQKKEKKQFDSLIAVFVKS